VRNSTSTSAHAYFTLRSNHVRSWALRIFTRCPKREPPLRWHCRSILLFSDQFRCALSTTRLDVGHLVDLQVALLLRAKNATNGIVRLRWVRVLRCVSAGGGVPGLPRFGFEEAVQNWGIDCEYGDDLDDSVSRCFRSIMTEALDLRLLVEPRPRKGRLELMFRLRVCSGR
jgi:hypothetical protein